MNCNNLLGIHIDYGNILYVPEGFAQRCPNIGSLYLMNNNIQVIDKNAFRGLSRLQIADLRGNRLTCLAPEVFQNTPRLLEIYLQNNLLRTVDNSLFRNLQELKKLDFGNNLLSYIPLLDLTGTSLTSGTLGVAINGNPLKAIKPDLCTMFSNRPTNVTDTYWLMNFTCQPSLLSYTPTTKLNCQTMNANFQTCFAGWNAAMAVNTPCVPSPVCIPSTIWGKVLGLLQYFAF
jgi:Leucine-rich repeat (LRR) protein